MICNAILTNRYIGIDAFYILGGTLTSPFIFLLDDIVAEIYGYKITRFMILSGFCAQTVFVLVCLAVVNSPHPSFFKANDTYRFILGISLLRINISGFFAYIMANLINSYILTKWKILLKGKKFWLRSIGSSVFSEALYSILAILLMEINSIPIQSVLKIILISFSIKFVYSIVFSGPGQMVVEYIKRMTGLDVFDFPGKFTPFKQNKITEEVEI